MLACLPASGEPAFRLPPRTQMNTGLQKWETTQKMRSASHPTTAELDAYAKKVANNPLNIQIFPNSIKVPQKKHVRRTVNGLDTSSSGQCQSPYPPQAAASGGLLAVLRVPLRGLIRQADGCRTRQRLRAAMNPQSAPYAAQGAPTLPHPAVHLAGVSQKPGDMAVPHHHPQALQRGVVAHSQALPLQHPRSAPPHGVQRQPRPAPLQQEAPPLSSGAPLQHLPHMQTLKQQTAPPQGLLAQQAATQVPDGPQLQGLQEAPLCQYGPRKLPDADAPPNVTVSTSTIPLSMVAGLHQNRPSDLSSIVHQINQLCQARAGSGATSVCEGQIANPSPISRSQLISASSRVSSQHACGVSGCILMGHPDKAMAHIPAAALHSQPGAAGNNHTASFHSDGEKRLRQHHLQQQQHFQQQQRSWAQHQLAHMQQPPEGAHPCKTPRMEPLADCAFPSQSLGSAHKLPGSAHGFPLKHPADKTVPTSPAGCSAGPPSYMNGHYVQPPWGAVPQDVPLGYQGGHAPAVRIPGAKYRPGTDVGAAGQAKLMQHSVDYLGEDFQMPGLQEPSADMMRKMQRSALGHVKESGGGGHHPGYH